MAGRWKGRKAGRPGVPGAAQGGDSGAGALGPGAGILGPGAGTLDQGVGPLDQGAGTLGPDAGPPGVQPVALAAVAPAGGWVDGWSVVHSPALAGGGRIDQAPSAARDYWPASQGYWRWSRTAAGSAAARVAAASG